MVTLTITKKDGHQNTLCFDAPKVTIGRHKTNDVVLGESNVSKRHASILQRDSAFILVDQDSTNGTFVNGKRVKSRHLLQKSDQVFIGGFTLEVQPPAPPSPSPMKEAPNHKMDILAQNEEWKRGTMAPPPPFIPDEGTPSNEEEEQQTTLSTPSRRPPPPLKEGAPPSPVNAPSTTSPQPADTADTNFNQALRIVHDRLIEAMELRQVNVEAITDEALRAKTTETVNELIKTMLADGKLSQSIDRDALTEGVLNEALGLGALRALLKDDAVTEILVNHARQVYIERGGKLELTDLCFPNEQAVVNIIERIIAPIGRRIDQSSPIVDGRLKDGSRVNAIIPPLALNGPTLTIRKFSQIPLDAANLIDFGTLTPALLDFLRVAVTARQNIVISGGTGSGKTTTLNVLSSFIPDHDRIITIEDAAELKLGQAHTVRLESRPANEEGRGEVTIGDLVRNALRMRPDRIIVGECRGGETLDMLQAMNTGHDGSLTTVHANTPRDALSRLETMVLMSGMQLPLRAISEQISSAVNLIVQQTRFPDGSRRVTHVSEVTGIEGDVIALQDIFLFEQSGYHQDGKVNGTLKPTGLIPQCFEDLRAQGILVNLDMFQSH